MVEKIIALYRRFRLISYRDIFKAVQEKEGSLSATEAFSADVVNLLENPTVTQFAEYIGISQPNATYKVNTLVQKGYLEKVQNPDDRREIRIAVTEKFKGYFSEDASVLAKAAEKLQSQFSKEEIDTMERVLAALLTAVE